jgi:hypothetical protein
MRLVIGRVLFATLFVGVGWIAASGQKSSPDFELVIRAPHGETVVECRRGCALSWVERGRNPNASARSTFSFRCGGVSTSPCESGAIGGWLSTPR